MPTAVVQLRQRQLRRRRPGATAVQLSVCLPELFNGDRHLLQTLLPPLVIASA